MTIIYNGGEKLMQFKKSILGISLIAMSIGLIGCGNSNDTTSELPQNRQI